MHDKTPPWFRTQDFRNDDLAPNPEMRLGFATASPLAVTGIAPEDESRAIYRQHQSVCPICNKYRSEYEYGFGTFKKCKTCRDQHRA